MKSIVKSLTAFLIIVITFTSAEFVHANSSTADTLGTTELVDKEAEFEKMERSLLYGLSSDVNGVLEATFFNAVSYKTLYPEFESTRINNRVAELALNGNTHVVRYKAHLTLSYLKDVESFDVTDSIIPLIRENRANDAFKVLVESIQERQVAESGN